MEQLRPLSGAEYLRLVTATEEMRDAIRRAEEVRNDQWVAAKDELKERQETIDGFCADNPEPRSDKCRQQLGDLCSDEKRARDAFAIVDRKKRSLEDHAKKMHARRDEIIDAIVDYLPADGAGRVEPEDWKRVLVSDLLGDLQGQPLARVGINDIGELVEAIKSKRLTALVRSGDITESQAAFAKNRVNEFLARRAVLVTGLPPAPKDADIPAVTKPPKEPAAAAAASE